MAVTADAASVAGDECPELGGGGGALGGASPQRGTGGVVEHAGEGRVAGEQVEHAGGQRLSGGELRHQSPVAESTWDTTAMSAIGRPPLFRRPQSQPLSAPRLVLPLAA